MAAPVPAVSVQAPAPAAAAQPAASPAAGSGEAVLERIKVSSCRLVLLTVVPGPQCWPPLAAVDGRLCGVGRQGVQGWRGPLHSCLPAALLLLRWLPLRLRVRWDASTHRAVRRRHGSATFDALTPGPFPPWSSHAGSDHLAVLSVTTQSPSLYGTGSTGPWPLPSYLAFLPALPCACPPLPPSCRRCYPHSPSCSS